MPADRPVGDATLDLNGVTLSESSIVNSGMLPYIRMLLGLIEGIHFSHAEVVAWLRQVQRQRSMAHRSRRDYVLGFLHKHPP